MKIKTVQANVLKYGTPLGEVLEVSDETAQHLIKTGVAEELKEEKKKEPSKKAQAKKKD
ncbi:hypothetical protein CHCC5027_3563 [Bacillus paralicheniformis]|uniref:DUF7302 family protein n=1 Tax=Bacillus paralicheniformis TaxID=1648923 RepID=UPI00132A14F6|nr:hypothetical protein [Bacillus paralicheniformis]TWJ39650.1 hypothetical protein CHCC5027_3563 [Bacillus paralicheniformis]